MATALHNYTNHRHEAPPPQSRRRIPNGSKTSSYRPPEIGMTSLQAQAKKQALSVNQSADAITSYKALLHLSGYTEATGRGDDVGDPSTSLEYSAILSNIAVLYRRNGNPAEALRYFRQAVLVMERCAAENYEYGSMPVLARLHLFQIYQNESSLYRYLEDRDSCFDVYEKMLALINEVVNDLEGSNNDGFSGNHQVDRRRHHLIVRAKTEYGRLHKSIGNSYAQEGEVQFALEHYQQSILWFRDVSEVGGDNKISSVDVFRQIEMIEPLSNSAEIYLDKNDLQNARVSWEECLKVLQSEVEADNQMVFSTIVNLAVVHEMMGEKELAFASHKKIYEMREKKLGETHHETSISMIHIGNYHLSKGELDEAAKHFTKALANFRNSFDHFHPLVAGALYCIGCTYYQRGEYDIAMEQFEAAILIRKSITGVVDPRVAEVYIAMGQTYRKQDKIDEAMQNYITAMQIFEDCGFDDNHPSIQLTIRSADALDETEHSAEVDTPNFFDENSFGDSKSTNVSELAMLDNLIESGEFRQNTAETASNSSHNPSESASHSPFGSDDIVSMLSEKSKVNVEDDRATHVFIEKLRAQEKATGSNRDDIAKTFADIANIFFERGDKYNDITAKLYQEALLIQQQELEFAMTLGKLADVYVRKGLYEQALESYREALDMYRKSKHSEDHPNIQRILRSISLALDEEQRCF